MKILVDENIPRMTVESLRQLGHDVRDIRRTTTQGLADSELWNVAIAEKRLLISTDKGFTEYRSAKHNGILIVRLRQPNTRKIHQRVMLAFDSFPESDWNGLLVVMRDAVMSASRPAG